MSIEEFLDSAFPQGSDNTCEWLCHCLSPSQTAMVIAMLEFNDIENSAIAGSEQDVDAAYKERIQRLRKLLDEMTPDGEEYLTKARQFVKEHQLW